jgi:hypothetical protein
MTRLVLPSHHQQQPPEPWRQLPNCCSHFRPWFFSPSFLLPWLLYFSRITCSWDEITCFFGGKTCCLGGITYYCDIKHAIVIEVHVMRWNNMLLWWNIILLDRIICFCYGITYYYDRKHFLWWNKKLLWCHNITYLFQDQSSLSMVGITTGSQETKITSLTIR